VPIRGRDLRDRLVVWQRNDANQPLLHGALTISQVALMALAVWTWHAEQYGLLVLVWALAIIVIHNKLIAFHETAHGLLHPVRAVNELIGQVLGIATLIPLTAYRIAHAQHHAYLGTERDVEFWPFVDPSVPRWRRVLALIAELSAGYFFEPIVMCRGVWVAQVPAAQRRRAAIEYGVCALHWGTVIAVMTWYGWWPEFLVAYFIPGYCAGFLNSWRRMIEHLGMLGDTVEAKSRTIVPSGPAAALVSAVVLHVDQHGTHHRFGRVPYYRLPDVTRAVQEQDPGALRVFPSYWSALKDMLPHMTNPRVGAQWLTAQETPSAARAIAESADGAG
jgi:fatty acid desaturase